MNCRPSTSRAAGGRQAVGGSADRPTPAQTAPEPCRDMGEAVLPPRSREGTLFNLGEVPMLLVERGMPPRGVLGSLPPWRAWTASGGRRRGGGGAAGAGRGASCTLIAARGCCAIDVHGCARHQASEAAGSKFSPVKEQGRGQGGWASPRTQRGQFAVPAGADCKGNKDSSRKKKSRKKKAGAGPARAAAWHGLGLQPAIAQHCHPTARTTLQSAAQAPPSRVARP